MDVESVSKQAPDVSLYTMQALKYGKDLARLYLQEKARRHELQLAHQKLRAILETAPNGLAVLDENMTIVEVNPRFEAMVECQGGCTGHSLAALLPGDGLVGSLEAVASQGTGFAEVEVSVSSPLPRTFHLIAAPLSAGEQRGWVISLHDITERKRLEGLKGEFINIAAHELRTPLAIILGYASVLREEAQTDDTLIASGLDAILNASHRLTMVVDELVSLADVRDISADSLEEDDFDLRDVIAHTVSSVTHQARLKEVEILVEVPDEPVPVHGDRVILAQAVSHLLDNAVKYNRPGGRVWVRAAQVNGETSLEIEDNGIGIPRTDLDRIFEMFYQVEGHMTRSERGLGLGLTIARRALELHGGQISVESRLGQGSRFRITLPRSVRRASIPSETRLEAAHRQTLAYGRDLARAFAAQQALAQRLRRIAALGQPLLERLEQLIQDNPDSALAPLLDEVRDMQALLDGRQL
ncbi:MAG: hypothetical protein Kow0063_17620 [Anaerolineae bacterium]